MTTALECSRCGVTVTVDANGWGDHQCAPPITRMYCALCHCSVGYGRGICPPPVICHECVRSGRYRREGASL